MVSICEIGKCSMVLDSSICKNQFAKMSSIWCAVIMLSNELKSMASEINLMREIYVGKYPPSKTPARNFVSDEFKHFGKY